MVRLIRGSAPPLAWLLLSVFVAGAASAATGSFRPSAFAACVRHRGASSGASSSPDAVGWFHPRPSTSVFVIASHDVANAFFYPSATVARAGETHYVADMVNLNCSGASAKLRQTCVANIRAKTQPLARYTVANVFVQFHSERPSAKLRGIVATCLSG